MRGTEDHDAGGIGRRRALKAGAGAVAAGIGATAFAGTAAAHFPEHLEVDVQPWREGVPIDPDGAGFVSVLVRPVEYEDEGETVTFDPTERDVRYRFGDADVVAEGGGARPVGDGHPVGDALSLTFPVEDAGFDAESTTARLDWERDESGEHGLSGSDEVTVADGRDRRGHHGFGGRGWGRFGWWWSW